MTRQDWLVMAISRKSILVVPNVRMSHDLLRVGIGGPVGSGKTALLLNLCCALRDKYNLAAITNNIYTWTFQIQARLHQKLYLV